MPMSKKTDLSKASNRIASNGDLLLYGMVGDNWEGMDALTIVEEIRSLQNNPINVHIHSPGGYITEGLAIYNGLKMSGKKVVVTIDGIAASMASVIAMAGDEVHMPENAWLMIHKPSILAVGTADDLRKTADVLDGFETDILNIYMKRYNGERDTLAEMVKDETWISAQQALEMGFIDKIIEPAKAVAQVDFTNLKNPPAAVAALCAGISPTANPANVIGATPMPDPVKQTPANGGAANPAENTPAVAQVPQEAVDAAVANALKARDQINSDIRALAQKVRLSDAEVSPILAQNLSLDGARAAILEVVAKRDAGNQPVPHVTIQNNTATLRADITKGLMVKAGQAPRNEANQFTHRSLMQIAEAVCVANGISTAMMTINEIAAKALSTSDLPNILADVSNKSLREGYGAYPRTFTAFARKTTASDFKPINRMQLGDAPALEEVKESGEFKSGNVIDGKESYALKTYGKIIPITRKTLINDDLDALTRVPRAFGNSAAQLENSIVWGLITSNAKLSDNVALFHATHANLGSALALSETTLSELRKLMRLQKALGGSVALNLAAKYLAVPAALETSAQKLLSAVLAAQTSNVNVFANTLELIVEPLLDANSTTAHYTFASPDRIDTIEYSYLSGEEGVYIETQQGFDVDGIQIKARLDFGAGLIDFRGMAKNAGA